MNERRDPDAILAAWLDGGPTELPDLTRRAIVAALPATQQARRGPLAPWRFLPMNGFSRMAAAVLVAALALGGAVFLIGRGNPSVGGPTASPSPSPTLLIPAPSALPASALATFSSPVYGYSINYPEAWRVRQATRRLSGTEIPWDYSDAVDEIAAPSNVSVGHSGVPGGNILVASAQMPGDTTLESWTASTATTICGAPTSSEDITVDGEAARLSTIATCFGGFHQWVTVLHGNRAWHIIWLNDPGTEVADRTFFEQLLPTFRFGELPAPTPAPS